MKPAKRQKPKKTVSGRVLAFGTFDLVHPGHLFYLSKAKKMGKELVVIVARDKNALFFKGTVPVLDEKTRLNVVSSLKFVDKAVLGQRSNFFDIIKKFNPELVALGYDQWPGRNKLLQYLEQNNIGSRIVRLPAHQPNIFKSTVIKKKIKSHSV